jgi:release factor glutamine methyltransferase
VTPQGVASRDSYVPGPGESWTPIRLTRWSGQYLGEKGIENGRLDAELILAHVLGIRRLDLYLQFDRPLRSEELEVFKSRLKRRAGREPLQYVLGMATFRELEIRTDPRALIPRPETEVLVEEVLTWARSRGAEAGEDGVSGASAQADSNQLSVLDVGTGSGAIVLSLLREGPFSGAVATDLSQGALELARENAEVLGLSGQVDFRSGSLLEPIGESERFHVIVSNPPYVPIQDRGSLQKEVSEWEPAEALFAGPEGLDVLLPLAREAAAFLDTRGLLALEVGEGQAAAVSEVMQETQAFQAICIKPDLAGRERVLLGVASN